MCTICCDKDLVKFIPWLRGYFSMTLLFKHTKYPCGKRSGTWLSVAIAHYSNDNKENNKLTQTAKDLCGFLAIKGLLSDFDNDYRCMADVLYYMITSNLEQKVPELEEHEKVLTVQCETLLPHGLP